MTHNPRARCFSSSRRPATPRQLRELFLLPCLRVRVTHLSPYAYSHFTRRRFRHAAVPRGLWGGSTPLVATGSIRMRAGAGAALSAHLGGLVRPTRFPRHSKVAGWFALAYRRCGRAHRVLPVSTPPGRTCPRQRVRIWPALRIAYSDSRGFCAEGTVPSVDSGRARRSKLPRRPARFVHLDWAPPSSRPGLFEGPSWPTLRRLIIIGARRVHRGHPPAHVWRPTWTRDVPRSSRPSSQHRTVVDLFHRGGGGSELSRNPANSVRRRDWPTPICTGRSWPASSVRQSR